MSEDILPFICPSHGKCAFWYLPDAQRVCEICYPRNCTPVGAAVPVNEATYLAGADVYKQNCAICHGLPDQPQSPIARAIPVATWATSTACVSRVRK